MQQDAKMPQTVGFYTVVEHEQHGLFGGLLLLNTTGRPLEFHCTAPLKPNRAQEILYGASLESYLYGEAIGRALLAKVSAAPQFVCVDRPPALALRECCESPVALVVSPAEPGSGAEPLFRVDAAHGGASLRMFSLGRHRLGVHRRYGEDEAHVTTSVGKLGEHFDLLEPFARIRGAIEEAQRSGR
jgi:hypothetical protein